MVNCIHHYLEVVHEIFICKYCGKAIWQPHNYPTAVVYANEVEKLGSKEAYKKRLQKMPKVNKLLNRLNAGDLDVLKNYVPQKIDETDEMIKILKRKGLADTILGEL